MSQLKKEIDNLASNPNLSNKDISKIVGCSPRTVHRHVGSHYDRCKQNMTSDVEDIFEVQKTILLPDIHYPHYEQKVMDAVEEFMLDYEPDEIIYMGDQMSLDCISSWNKRKPLLKEGQRLLKEYEGFDHHILETHENITHPDTKRTFMMGNHENRVAWYCEEHPELEGIIDIDQHLNLTERGYNIIPYNEIYKIGKLNVIHGFYWNKYHAAKTIEAFEGNVVYAHVHNPQMYSKISPIDRKGYHTATSLPCLCNIKPDYGKNAPNFWLNGFGIVEHLPATQMFNLYTIIIVDGAFMWDGKYYGKNL